MEIMHLRYFKKTAEMQNISKAAMLLHIAQPYLSRVIHNLESELNTPLFDRTGRNIVLNENGQKFLYYVERILNDYDSALSALDNASHCINIVTLNSTQIFPELISLYSTQHPEKHFIISDYKGINEIPSNTDIVIHASNQLAEKYPTKILFEEPCYIGVSKNSPVAQKKELSLEDLQNTSFLTLVKENPLGILTQHYLNQFHLHVNILVQAASQQALSAFVAQGLGFAIFPGKTWKIDSSKIVLKTIKNCPMSRQIYITTLSQNISSENEELIDFLVASAKAN